MEILKEFITTSRKDPRFKIGEAYDKCTTETRRILFCELFRLVCRQPAADRTVILRDASPISDPRYDHNYTGLGEYDEGEVYEDTDSSDTAPEGPPLKRRKISEIRPVVDTESGDVDICADALMVKGYFSERWAYEPPIDSKPGKAPIDLVSWNDHDLDMQPGKPGLKHFDGPPSTVRPRWELHSQISSYLLLYRLYVVFGTPYPSSEVDLDPLKQVWGYKLYWMPPLECTEEGQSSLTLEDWKGSCQLSFWGSEEASRSALRLAEWLVSDNVAHPCDYALAGTAA